MNSFAKKVVWIGFCLLSSGSIANASNTDLAKAILCKNDDAKAKGPNQCDHYLISKQDDKIRLDILSPDSNASCGLIVFINEIYKSGDQYSLDGHASSSEGFNRSIHSFAELDLDLATGEGTLRTKEGKIPEVYFHAWKKEQLSECKFIETAKK